MKENSPQLNRANLDVAGVASKDTTRPALTHVLVDKTCTVATDSYALLKVDTLSGGHSAFQAPAKAMKEASKVLGKNGTGTIKQTIDDTADNHIETDTSSMRVSNKFDQHQQYPNYDFLIPSDDQEYAGIVKLDAKILKQLTDYLAKHAKKGYITLSIPKPDKSNRVVNPVLIKAETTDEQSITGLIMPVLDK